MFQKYFRYALGVLGAFFGIYCGGYVAVAASVNLVTEFSTPLINLRSILLTFKETNGPVYIYNGFFMTLSFFIVRCVF